MEEYVADELKVALLTLVDEGMLPEARKVLERLHDKHQVDDSVYDQLSGYLLGGHTVHRQWEDALELAQSMRCRDRQEKRVGQLTGQMAFQHD